MDPSALQAHFYSLYEQGQYTDTVIRVDGRKFLCHKAVLAQSAFFSAIMSGVWAGNASIISTTQSVAPVASGGGQKRLFGEPGRPPNAGQTQADRDAVHPAHLCPNATLELEIDLSRPERRKKRAKLAKHGRVAGPGDAAHAKGQAEPGRRPEGVADGPGMPGFAQHAVQASAAAEAEGHGTLRARRGPMAGTGVANSNTTATMGRAAGGHVRTTTGDRRPSVGSDGMHDGAGYVPLGPWAARAAAGYDGPDVMGHGLAAQQQQQQRGGPTPYGHDEDSYGMTLGDHEATARSDGSSDVTSQSSTEAEPDSVTLLSFEALLQYLYGRAPVIRDLPFARALLVTSSYFDCPPLAGVVSDWVFTNLTPTSAVPSLAMVLGREYGEQGKLIEDAAMAFLHRNALDVGSEQLAALPAAVQAKLMTASELWIPSEFARYRLAVATYRAAIARITAEARVEAQECHRRGSLASLARQRAIHDQLGAGQYSSSILSGLHGLKGRRQSTVGHGQERPETGMGRAVGMASRGHHSVRMQLRVDMERAGSHAPLPAAAVRAQAWPAGDQSGREDEQGYETADDDGQGHSASGTTGHRAPRSSMPLPLAHVLAKRALYDLSSSGSASGSIESAPPDGTPSNARLLAGHGGVLLDGPDGPLDGTQGSTGLAGRLARRPHHPTLDVGDVPDLSMGSSHVASHASLSATHHEDGLDGHGVGTGFLAGSMGGLQGSPEGTGSFHTALGTLGQGGLASSGRTASSRTSSRAAFNSPAAAIINSMRSSLNRAFAPSRPSPLHVASMGRDRELGGQGVVSPPAAAAAAHGERPIRRVPPPPPPPPPTPSHPALAGGLRPADAMDDLQYDNHGALQTLNGTRRRLIVRSGDSASSAVGRPAEVPGLAFHAYAALSSSSSFEARAAMLPSGRVVSPTGMSAHERHGHDGDELPMEYQYQQQQHGPRPGASPQHRDRAQQSDARAHAPIPAVPPAATAAAGPAALEDLLDDALPSGRSARRAAGRAVIRNRSQRIADEAEEAARQHQQQQPQARDRAVAWTQATGFGASMEGHRRGISGQSAAWGGPGDASGATGSSLGEAADAHDMQPTGMQVFPHGHSTVAGTLRSAAESLWRQVTDSRLAAAAAAAASAVASSLSHESGHGHSHGVAAVRQAWVGHVDDDDDMSGHGGGQAGGGGHATQQEAQASGYHPGQPYDYAEDAHHEASGPSTATGASVGSGAAGGMDGTAASQLEGTGGRPLHGQDVAWPTGQSTAEHTLPFSPSPVAAHAAGSTLHHHHMGGGQDEDMDGGLLPTGHAHGHDADDHMDGHGATVMSDEGSDDESPVEPLRDYRAELTDLKSRYEEVWSGIRWFHLTPEQLEQVQAEAEVPPTVISDARAMAARVRAKLDLGCHYNVKRLSELSAFADGLPDPTILKFEWPGFRFGVEVHDLFGPEMTPFDHTDSRTVSSDKVYFAGSLWCLDFKRYRQSPMDVQPDQEPSDFVAVYLRRRSAKQAVDEERARNPTSPGQEGYLFEDTRDRTTLAFSIRLCGAPGAPTSNSVCGKSVMGKSFGTDQEQSWGWENFVNLSSLTDRANWSSGDVLRFVVNLDML